MQELVYSLKNVLKQIDLIRNWVDIEVENSGAGLGPSLLSREYA